MAKSIIISCAITGSIHVPSMSPYLPITPEDIANQAIDAANAGASILHLHARHPDTGKPVSDPNVFMQFLPKIHQSTDAVINISTGGGQGMSVDQRIEAAMKFAPELCSLNMGSMNFATFPLADKITNWKYDWEEDFIRSTEDFIFKNTFADIENILTSMGAKGTKFEYECYDVGHLYNLAYFVDKQIAKPPLFIQFVLGVMGGIGADVENLSYMIRVADKLFGSDYEFSVLAAGRHQMPLALTSATSKGNVRVGLEDSLMICAGELAKSNAQQVEKIVTMLNMLSLKPASVDETRNRLALKGKENINL